MGTPSRSSRQSSSARFLHSDLDQPRRSRLSTSFGKGASQGDNYILQMLGLQEKDDESEHAVMDVHSGEGRRDPASDTSDAMEHAETADEVTLKARQIMEDSENAAESTEWAEEA